MLIEQKISGKEWLVTVNFEEVTLMDHHFPVYITGNFNRWKTDFEYNEEAFRVSTKPYGGSITLLSYTITVPYDWNFVEFRLMDADGFMNFEKHKKLFKGDINLEPNIYGTTNVIVYNNLNK